MVKQEKHCNRKLYYKIKKILSLGLEPIVEKIFSSDDEKAVLAREVATIATLGIENLCNLTFGGEGNSPTQEIRDRISATLKGRKPPPVTEETKRKISAAQKGKRLSVEHRRKLSEARKGKPRSKESIEKFSATMRGHTVSEETRKKIGDAQRGKKISEEAKRKTSAANRGKVRSAEFKANLSRINKGKVISAEQRAKISKARTGILHTAATKEKLRAAWVRRKAAREGMGPCRRSEETKERMRWAWVGRKARKMNKFIFTNGTGQLLAWVDDAGAVTTTRGVIVGYLRNDVLLDAQGVIAARFDENVILSPRGRVIGYRFGNEAILINAIGEIIARTADLQTR